MYQIIFSKQSEKFITKLKNKDKRNFQIIFSHLNNLSKNPKIFGKPLTQNLSGLWSYRAADFRIIYEIKDNLLLVIILEIGHRKNIYGK